MNKRIGINVITNLIAMILSLLINFFLTPILTNRLGMGAYSYVGIITNVLSFFTVLTYTLNSMVGRFYTYTYNNDKNLSNKYISSALVTCLLLAAVLFPILSICSYKLDSFIKIDINLVNDVKFAFFLSSCTFLLGTISSVFFTGAYCKNRLDLSNIINIIANILRTLLIFLLFKLFDSHIWYIGFSTIIQNIICIILGYIIFKRLIPEVNFSLKLFDLKYARELLSAGLFNSVILLGQNLMTQIDLLVGNRYIDSELIGKYAVILLFSNTLRSLASALSSAFSPTTVNAYSKGDLKYVVKNSSSAVDFCGTILGWPISIIASLGIYFLSFWLHKDFCEFKYMIILMMLPLNVNLSVSQLNVVNQAANKLKLPAISAIVCGIINFGLAILLTKIIGLWGILIASVIGYTLNNLIVLPFYTAKITNQNLFTYYNGLIRPFICTITTCFIGLVLVKYLDCKNITMFFAECVILTCIYFILIFVLINKEQKELIFSKIKNLFKKIGLFR